mgnify:CR=1 FL=1
MHRVGALRANANGGELKLLERHSSRKGWSFPTRHFLH